MCFFSKVVLAWVAALAAAHGVLQLQSVRAQQASGAASDSQPTSQPAAQSAGSPADSPHRLLLRRYCTSCHNDRLKTAGLSLDGLDLSRVGDAAETWEKVVRKLRGGIMPPVGRPRPDAASVDAFASSLESELDRAAAASPNPGRIPVHRLNRAEYTNAIRDLLALEINGPALLPADEVGHGFDNIAGNLTLSPALLERYMSAARRISRLAVGDPSIGPGYTSKIYVVPINKTQNDRMSEDLPFGSRAGLAVRHHFPLDGEYSLRIKLKKSVYEYVVNLEEAHDLDVRLDGVRLQRHRIGGVQAGKPAPVELLRDIHGRGRSRVSHAGVGRLPHVRRRPSRAEGECHCGHAPGRGFVRGQVVGTRGDSAAATQGVRRHGDRDYRHFFEARRPRPREHHDRRALQSRRSWSNGKPSADFQLPASWNPR